MVRVQWLVKDRTLWFGFRQGHEFLLVATMACRPAVQATEWLTLRGIVALQALSVLRTHSSSFLASNKRSHKRYGRWESNPISPTAQSVA